jgi:outer membrane immunogenic protein
MRGSLITGVLVVAVLGSTAFAADLPQSMPGGPKAYVPYTALAYNWSGLYIGVNGGYGVGRSNWSDANNPSGTTSTGNFDISGYLVGGTIGANFQTGEFVFGAEVDVDYSGINGTTSPASGYCTLTNIAFLTATGCKTQNTWLGTARGRLGYAFDRVLVYGTGGLAFGNIHAGITGPGITATYDSTAAAGWTAGGGVEVALGDHLTGKIEYLYVNLANGTCTTANCGYDSFNPITGTLNAANDTVKFNTNIIRGGINYKFDWE